MPAAREHGCTVIIYIMKGNVTLQLNRNGKNEKTLKLLTDKQAWERVVPLYLSWLSCSDQPYILLRLLANLYGVGPVGYQIQGVLMDASWAYYLFMFPLLML